MPRASEPSGALAIRFILVVASFALLWLMEWAFTGVREEATETLEIDTGLWLGAVAFGVLAGAAFAAAGRYGSLGGGYRWTRALVVAGLPFALVVVNYLYLAGALASLPGILQPVAFLFAPIGHAIEAVLLGVGLVAGASGGD